MPSARALREVAWMFIAITLASIVISRVGAAPPLSEYVHVAIATLFLWTALHFAQRDPRGVAHYGLALGGFFEGTGAQSSLFNDIRDSVPSLLRELGVALLVALVVFPPFVLGFAWWHQPTRDFTFVLAPDLATYVLAQVLVVALPEEALFRGYFQTRCLDIGHTAAFSVTLVGQRIPWLAIVAQAVLFALVHFAVDLNLARLAVFFPGLLFGLLRAWRHGVGAAVFVHAFCNLLSDTLVRGWL